MQVDLDVIHRVPRPEPVLKLLKKHLLHAAAHRLVIPLLQRRGDLRRARGARLFDAAWELIGHFCRRRAAAARVGEDVKH